MRKWIYIIFGIIFSLYLLVSFNDFHWGIALLSALFFPIFLLVFLHKIDVFEREKFKNLFTVFLLSFITSFICCFLWVPIREQLLGGLNEGFISNLLGAGLPEEIIKILPVIIILKRTKYINEPIDYLIYASSSALGFAFIENIDYIYDFKESSPNIIACRSLLPTFMHMTCTSIFAFGIFFFQETGKIKYLIGFYLFASFNHALYNAYLSYILIFFSIIYYSRLMRSLLNISPFYDEKKIILLKKGQYILGFAFIILHVINVVFINFYSNYFKTEITSQIWFNDFIFILTAFIFHKIVSRNLKINKGEFKILGKKRIRLLSNLQQIVIDNYYAKFKDINEI